jgi:hypothetical protein
MISRHDVDSHGGEMKRHSKTIAIASMPSPSAPSALCRKRILIVNCYFDDDRRRAQPLTRKLPKPMGPVYLASGSVCSRALRGPRVLRNVQRAPRGPEPS